MPKLSGVMKYEVRAVDAKIRYDDEQLSCECGDLSLQRAMDAKNHGSKDV